MEKEKKRGKKKERENNDFYIFYKGMSLGFCSFRKTQEILVYSINNLGFTVLIFVLNYLSKQKY